MVRLYVAFIRYLVCLGTIATPFDVNQINLTTNQEVIMALDKAKKEEIVAKYGRGTNDTGSTEVQVALITERIIYLTDHLKTNKKDHSSRLGLLKLVGQRRRLMRYLKNNDIARYNIIKAALGIRN
jgi:small subunit ribosomal protein S15